jgi:carbon monoxide dehydrogenase subunit G
VAIEIRETFQVQAPIDAVWQFVMDPQQVVTCMPGAALDQVVDAQTFLGTVKVKVGAITATYKGRVQFTQVDHQGHSMQMVAEGRETGGGMAKGTMASRLRAVSAGQTEVVAEASVDLTGRLMQVGRGMIQGVARQLFQQFAESVTRRLEVAEAAAAADGAGRAAVPPAVHVGEPEAIRVVPLLLRTLWSAIVRLWRRMLGSRDVPR